MALLLRKLEKKSHWDRASEQSLSALGAGADVLRDLNTSSGTLSVYRIEDDNGNLDRVIAALCANRNVLSNFDYVLIPEESVQEIASVKDTHGETKDEAVNGWHRDVTGLSVGKVVRLIECILPAERERILRKQVEAILRESLQQGWLDINDFDEKIRQKFTT